MEKQFNAHWLSKKPSENSGDGYPAQLRRSHLWIAADLASRVFGDARQSYADFDPENSLLRLSPMENKDFKEKYPECSLIMLKDRSLQGDKTLSLQEVIIDNDLDDEDRPLEYQIDSEGKILSIKLAEQGK